MISPMDLTGKHILVTGASRGIGRAVCVLASKLGAKVSMAARSEEGLKETLSMMENSGAGGGTCYPCDLTDEKNIEELVKNCVSQNGKLDGLVHCAGVAMNVPLKMSTWEKTGNMMAVNYMAFLTLVRMAGNKRYGNDGASLVGISSIAAFHGDKTQEMYSATKAAVASLTAPVAKEFGERRIRVNHVVFGMVRTDMYKGFLDNCGDTGSLLEKQSLGIVEPEDAANGICFLLSDASRMITGTSVVIDGGFLASYY